jgi:hypothetical protein
MDFIVRLPRNQCGHGNIFVVVDKLTKHAYFLVAKSTMSIMDGKFCNYMDYVKKLWVIEVENL